MKTTTDCHCQHDIPRDGSGQRQRYLKALDPTYAPIDARSLEDLLVYAKRYAAQIRFWPIPDDQQGDDQESWREFFRRDCAVVAASVAVTDLVQIRKDYDDIRRDVEATPTRDRFRALFDPILGMARRLDRWYSVAIPGKPLHNDLTLLINSVLRAQIGQIMAYEESFRAINANKGLNLDYSHFENPKLWGLDDDIPATSSIYEGDDLADQLRNAALFVDDVFQAFYNALRRLVEGSDKYMQFALEQYPAHQPHMALFIAFLELFRLAQDQLNTLTQKHLAFYYRDVLRLHEQPARPDHVHVVFELAQDVSDYFLPKGTPLLAGRDALGKDLIYHLSDDFVANQAQVKELKTIRLVKNPATKTINRLYARPNAKSKDGQGEAFDDEYGKWDAFGKGDIDLGALRNPCDIVRADAEVRIDQKAIGFGIASPQLLLQGGNRKLELTIKGLTELSKHPETLEIWLTGDKEWIRVAHQLTDQAEILNIEEQLKNGLFTLPDPIRQDEEVLKTGLYFFNADTLHIYLPLSAPAIVPYDSEKHGGLRKSVVQPVLTCLVREIDTSELAFAQKLSLDDVIIRTKVGSTAVTNQDIAGRLNPLSDLDGLKKLVLQNDAGLIDASNSFDPFTAYPVNFPSLYIGSDEVFNKPPSAVVLQVEWANGRSELIPAGPGNEKQVFKYLYNRTWKELEPFLKEAKRTPVLPVTLANNDTLKGFVRWTINGLGFSEERDPNFFVLQQQVAQRLRMKSIAVCYDSKLTGLQKGIDQFLHIYPFGIADATVNKQLVALFPQFVYPNATKSLLQELAKLDLPPQPVPLLANANKRAINVADALPVFIADQVKKAYRLNQYTYATESNPPPAGNIDPIQQEEGFLYIGLTGLKPLQTLSLLFQIAEGTAEDEDYTEDPPEIHWSYVVDDEMRPLPSERILSDGTYGLQTTGIIKFDIPKDLVSTNTLLTDGLSWLCASVTEHADRVPKLIDVRAQATEAVFTDQQNAPAHYLQPLPATSISKLLTNQAEIKRIEQPFASFDGKPQEAGGFFYARVSERLRHKARAINTWDYEHLILEAFPHTYKVKCITHTDPTCLCREPTPLTTPPAGNPAPICCGPQVAPGHVLIIPISDFKNRNAVNPLQPKTSYRLLRRMEEFLKKRTSPFVTIHARNPRYEEVIVTFRVKFYEGVDKGFHLKKLNDELVRYLTPWAFEETADVSFDQKIYASAVINFIEERLYVDFITDFKMGVCQEQCCPPDTTKVPQGAPETLSADVLKGITNCDDLEQLLEGDNPWQVTIAPSTSRSLVVSVPQHLILLYEEEPEQTPCEKRKNP
ncbi:hypothetical protein [Spirosoma radiotolerans]|uniref:Baseplate protein J-like domain-containing protein n=1 Tax=Spirosoma radiotolerans TaxID=1379870 RepID=A0A0E3V734_9BACT|nr:hypothetical protein [Spirosoma radiotolerans]AKD55542.1 hypothetical protein SD10_12175 [Spirosoma radiotolerans]